MNWSFKAHITEVRDQLLKIVPAILVKVLYRGADQIEYLLGCGLSSPTMAACQRQVQESCYLFIPWIWIFSLFFIICWIAKEVGSKASEGMNLLARARVGRQREKIILLLCPLFRYIFLPQRIQIKTVCWGKSCFCLISTVSSHFKSFN